MHVTLHFKVFWCYLCGLQCPLDLLQGCLCNVQPCCMCGSHCIWCPAGSCHGRHLRHSCCCLQVKRWTADQPQWQITAMFLAVANFVAAPTGEQKVCFPHTRRTLMVDSPPVA